MESLSSRFSIPNLAFCLSECPSELSGLAGGEKESGASGADNHVLTLTGDLDHTTRGNVGSRMVTLVDLHLGLNLSDLHVVPLPRWQHYHSRLWERLSMGNRAFGYRATPSLYPNSDIADRGRAVSEFGFSERRGRSTLRAFGDPTYAYALRISESPNPGATPTPHGYPNSGNHMYLRM